MSTALSLGVILVAAVIVLVVLVIWAFKMRPGDGLFILLSAVVFGVAALGISMVIFTGGTNPSAEGGA